MSKIEYLIQQCHTTHKQYTGHRRNEWRINVFKRVHLLANQVQNKAKMYKDRMLRESEVTTQLFETIKVKELH